MKTIKIIALIPLLTYCTSLNRQSKAELEHQTTGNTFVVQGQSQAYAYSTEERNYWLKSRASKTAKTQALGALATGEAESAVELARAALQKNPADISALSILASSLTVLKEYELAFYYADELEKVYPESALAANIKGLATMLKLKPRASDFALAKQYFRTAMERDSREIAAGLNLGYLELELGQHQSAQSIFEDVAQRSNKECLAATLGVGIASLRAGKPDIAKKALEEILAKNPNHPDALYHLALVYKNGYNNPEKARNYLTTLLKRTKIQNLAIKERASSTLRKMNGESPVKEREAIAQTESEDDALILQAGFKEE